MAPKKNLILKRPASAFPPPKKGKARSLKKVKVKAMKATKPFVPYVRHGLRTQKSRGERMPCSRVVADFYTADAKGVVDFLKRDSILPELHGEACPHCVNGVLGPMKFMADRGWHHRCSRCKCYVLPHGLHPIFTQARGPAHYSLRDQAITLFYAVSGLTEASCHRLTGFNHKFIEGVYLRLDEARKEYVEREEKTIRFGEGEKWKDVEADEVDLRKLQDDSDESGRPVRWEQWGGIVERGNCCSLVLTRLEPMHSKKRSPGPGPIRKRDWAPIAKRWLQDRQVVLHTDGARAYKMFVPGMLHDNVVHQKKRVQMGKIVVWVKPKFTKIVAHSLPGGETLHTQAGTQIIDRFWRTLREHLGSRASCVGSKAMTRRIRSAQWVYWNRHLDAWQRTGDMLKALRSQAA